MKKFGVVKMMGLVVAVGVVLFGGVGNLVRTVKFAGEKWWKR